MHRPMSQLWHVDNQGARLAELTAQDVELKEVPLRRDVRSLGRLLGEVLKEQAGQALFDAVEELRLLAIRHRESNAGQEENGFGGSAQSELMESAGQVI